MSEFDGETHTELHELFASGELTFGGMHPIQVGSISFHNDQEFDVVAAADALDKRFKGELGDEDLDMDPGKQYLAMCDPEKLNLAALDVFKNIDFKPGQMGLSDPTKSLGSKNTEVGIT